MKKCESCGKTFKRLKLHLTLNPHCRDVIADEKAQRPPRAKRAPTPARCVSHCPNCGLNIALLEQAMQLLNSKG